MATQNELDKMYLNSMQSNGQGEKTEYDYLRDNAASEVLNQQIQMANAKEQASKALNQQLSSNGMYGSGYASNRQNAIDQAYIQGMQMAQANYGNQLSAISQAESNSNAEATSLLAEKLVGNLSNTEDATMFNSYLSDMGLSVDEYGNVVNTGNKYNFTDSMIADIQNAYSAKTGYATINEALNGMLKGYDKTIADGLSDSAKRGELANDTAISLSGNNFVVFKNGRFIPISKEQFDAFKGAKKTY